jgi:2-octaprenyl-3-methyl-6-methoxy-1,4-benzoquinol hydroxylase/2-octaprenylphenol hydroxylase
MKNGYELLLGDKDKLTCKLLVGADGSRSKVRQVCEIEISENEYEQKAIIANIASEKPFEDTTWQRFLSDSIVALLPLSDKKASMSGHAKINWQKNSSP